MTEQKTCDHDDVFIGMTDAGPIVYDVCPKCGRTVRTMTEFEKRLMARIEELERKVEALEWQAAMDQKAIAYLNSQLAQYRKEEK